MKNLILKEMNDLGADGVDFVPFGTRPDSLYRKVFRSFTKEQISSSKDEAYPKSGRIYWKKSANGKEYIHD